MMVCSSWSHVLCLAILLVGATAPPPHRDQGTCGFTYTEENCCRTNLGYNKVAVGVCDDPWSAANFNRLFPGASLVGYGNNGTKGSHGEWTFDRKAAMSDDANEDNPGEDEGSCHMYNVEMGHGHHGHGHRQRRKPWHKSAKCLPGNVVMTAVELQKLIDETEGSKGKGKGHVGCSFAIGKHECRGRLEADEPYNFAFKLEGPPNLVETFDRAISGYESTVLKKCHLQTVEGKHGRRAKRHGKGGKGGKGGKDDYEKGGKGGKDDYEKGGKGGKGGKDDYEKGGKGGKGHTSHYVICPL